MNLVQNKGQIYPDDRILTLKKIYLIRKDIEYPISFSNCIPSHQVIDDAIQLSELQPLSPYVCNQS
jgi:hypothetical protein